MVIFDILDENEHVENQEELIDSSIGTFSSAQDAFMSSGNKANTLTHHMNTDMNTDMNIEATAVF